MFVARKKSLKKMSEIVKEMSLTLFKNLSADPSSEAAHAALLLSHVAWNRSLGEPIRDADCRSTLKEFEDSLPSFWDELRHNNWKTMIKELMAYKKKHYPGDTRIIEICGMRAPGVIQVVWTQPPDFKQLLSKLNP